MDFDWLQLVVLLGAVVFVNAWAWHRLAVPADRSAPPSRDAWLTVIAISAVGAAVHRILTIPSEDGFLLAVVLAPVQLVVLAVRFFRYNRCRGRPVSVRRWLFGNVLLLCIPLTALLAVGEVWFRCVHDATDSIGYTKVAQRWLARHYRFNNFGFRDSVDYALARDDRQHRISFVGDSFTAGHGIADVEQRFANRLRRQSPDWEVHVLAKNGHDTASETEQLTVAAKLGYVFDEVVLIYCLNDVMDLLPDWIATMEAAREQARGRLAVFDSSYLLDTVYYRVAIAQLRGVGDYFSFVGEAYRGALWQQQQARLRAFRAVVEQAGGRLSVVTWPLLDALGPDYPHREIHARLAEFWVAEGVPHLDLLAELEHHEPAELVVNSADAHPNEYASELAALAIGRWLRRVVVSPKPNRR